MYNRTNERVRRRVCNYLSVYIRPYLFYYIIWYSFYLYICIESLDIELYTRFSEIIHFSIDELNIIMVNNCSRLALSSLHTHSIINRETFDDDQVSVGDI